MSALFQGLESPDTEYVTPDIVLKLLESLLPALDNIVSRWYADASIIEVRSYFSYHRFQYRYYLEIGNYAIFAYKSLK